MHNAPGSRFCITRRNWLSHLRTWLAAGLALFAALSASRPIGAIAQVAFRSPPITLEDADKVLRSRVPATGGPIAAAPTQAQPTSGAQPLAAAASTGCASGSSLPVEIVTLASSLKCDVDLIFEYVYDNIEYEPLFGSNKGALGTLLDQRGDDIDQAQLFVALLNASGITQTSFQYGYITVTGPAAEYCQTTSTTPAVASAPGWLGVNNDAAAIVNLLLDGGIPTGNWVYNSDGTLVCLQVAHVWVQVTLNGVNYAFDPSFKQHTVSPGIVNLGSILGYTQAQFIADAAATTDSVSISNINRSKLRSDLTTYANNLINYIEATNPAWTMANVVGGKSIVPLTGSPIRQTSLPYLSTVQPSGFPQNWGPSVPNGYRTCIAITMPGYAPTTCANVAPNPVGCASQTPSSNTIVFFSDQTYGQRITVFSVLDPNISGNVIPTLLLNGAAPTSGVNTGPSTAPGGSWAINAAITHPYAGTGANQCKNLDVTAGGSYLIGAGWGQVGRGMVQKHRQLLAQALAANASPTSEPVLGESLAIVSYNWLAENAAQQQLGDAIGQATTQYHHGVGITAQAVIPNSGGAQGPYVDLPINQLAIGPRTCWPQTTCPFPAPILAEFYSDSGTSSSLESAVLEQTQAPTPNMIASSTIALVDQNAATSAKTFFADGTTSTGQSNYVNIIRPLLQQSGTAYSTTDLQAIDVAVTGASPPPTNPTVTQSQVLAPMDGAIAVGQWKGAGYTIISTTGTGSSEAISITQKISGGLDGGFSGQPVSTPDVVNNVYTTVLTTTAAPDVPIIINPPPSPANPTVNEPIDAITGTDVYSHSDIVIGSGAFPYALPFARTYLSSSNMSDVGLGNGWTHSYMLTAAANSDPYEGLGASSPIRAAQAIAAIYVSQNLLSGSAQSAQSLTLAWIVNRWLTDQLTNNAALIARPDTTEEFIFLPHADGATTIAFNPPLGSSVQLTGGGAGGGTPTTPYSPPTSYSYLTKDRIALNFAQTTANPIPISSWVYPNGVQVNFTYNGSGVLTTIANNLGRRLSLSYSGPHISSVSDGTRSISFSYSGNDLIGATDPLGYQTTFGYDGGDHLAQIFYPSNPGNAFVTNVYDGLGRVFQQFNANGQNSTFYFAGSRTEIVDAAGDRHITYQTPRGKVTKDAWVLSPSFGNVFNDTATQTGVVNVSTNQYDGQDRLINSTAPESGCVIYAYSMDLFSNITSITRYPKTACSTSPSPLTTTFAYDPYYNKPTRLTDPLGLVTAVTYDPATGNLLSSVADAGGAGHFNATSRFAYNAFGLLTSSNDALGVQTSYGYDSFGDLTSVVRDASGTGHLNQTTLSAYNTVGDAISTTDPNGNVATAAYDLDRRLTSVLSPPGVGGSLATAYAYDPNSNLLQTQQSSNGQVLRTTHSTYTLTGKVATATDANGNVTRYAYDVVDRLSQTTDPVGNVTVYGYDALSRPASLSNPAIQANPLWQRTYSADGLLASLMIARSNTVSDTTSFAYDGFDRLSTTTWPGSSTEVLSYDADSNILTRKTRRGDTIAFAYDTLNRLCTKAWAPPSVACGGTSSTTYLVSYAYDLASRLIGASDNNAPITAPSASASYAANYAYDARNELINVSWPATAQMAPSASTSVTFGYSYDGNNRRIGQTATDKSWWSYPTTATSIAYTANTLNQYTAVGSASPTYDGNGNLTYDGHFTYCYDVESRLTSILSAGTCASPTTTVAGYAYDSQGRRKSKTVGATTTYYATDADNREVLEYNGAGAIQNWYSFALGPDAVLNQMNVASSTRATLVPDVIGSVAGSLDAVSGTLTKFGYQTFGENPALTAGGYRYTARRLDPETLASVSQPSGLYYYRARMYAPGWGRFLQADPSGYPVGTNLYAYVNNDPLNNTDPLGLTPDAPRGSGGSASGNLLAVGAIGVAVGANVAGFPEVEIGEGVGLAVVGGVAVLGSTTVLMSSKPPKSSSQGVGPPADTAGTPQGPEDPNLGNLRKVSDSQLLQAARQDGYNSVEDWKTQELQLNSRSDIVRDSQGNLYSVPRQGRGIPQPLGVKLP